MTLIRDLFVAATFHADLLKKNLHSSEDPHFLDWEARHANPDDHVGCFGACDHADARWGDRGAPVAPDNLPDPDVSPRSGHPRPAAPTLREYARALMIGFRL